jgi:hypothetical protein
MALQQVYNLGGLNLYTNPLLKNDGDLIKAVNVDSYPLGSKRKRSGYQTFLGTANGSAVDSLFSWTKNNGDLFVYRASGGRLYYSAEGTGAWTLAGGGTVTSGNNIGYASLNDTLIIGDGAGSTRHSTNGTSFTNTTAAPVAHSFAEYQQRVYAAGTASNVFYSTVGTASDWTTDSSSLLMAGAGTVNYVVNANDRIVTGKSGGDVHRWDGYSQADVSTELAWTSAKSIAKREGYYFGLNRLGIAGYGGGKPEIISNPIQPVIYNDSGSAIAGTNFTTAPGAIYKYNYYLAVGTVTDDYLGETLDDCIIKYNYQHNEFLTYKFANNPTAFHTFVDTNGNEKMIFGASDGQVYEYGSTNADSGEPIQAEIEFVLHLGAPEFDKEWKWWRGIFNPGCQAQVSVAITNSFRRSEKDFVGLGDAKSGVVEYRPKGSDGRGKFLFVKIKEYSEDAPFTFYGYSVDANIIGKQ